jgi:hypothetical protein
METTLGCIRSILVEMHLRRILKCQKKNQASFLRVHLDMLRVHKVVPQKIEFLCDACEIRP